MDTTTSSTTTTDHEPTPTDQIDEEAGPWTESDLVFLTRIEYGATLTLDMHFPAEPACAPIVIDPTRSAIEDLVEEAVIVVTIDDDDHPGAGPGGRRSNT